MKKKITSGTPWEEIVGYSRAIRTGNTIEVAGTTAMDGDQLIGSGNVYVQAKYIFQKIESVLKQLNCSLKDVVRTRMYVTDIEQWQNAARAHAEFFSEIKPVTTMVEVSRLINDELLIEIEVTAIVS